MKSVKPDWLEDVLPQARTFPASWKDAAIRELFDEAIVGVECFSCHKIFRGLAELRLLQADHIIPWSRGGLTTWENMQLLCRPCNRSKSDWT